MPRRHSSTEMKNQMSTPMNPRRKFERLISVAVTGLALMTAVPAAAQQAASEPAAAAAPAVPPAALPSWTKTCDTDKASKKEVCIVTQELRADSGTFIASVALRRITGDKKYSLLATVPNGMLIKPGVKAQVDGNDAVTMVYFVCELRSCLAVGDVADAVVESLKTGKTLVLTTYSQQAKAVSFSLALSGFADALAAKGLDAEGFKKLQECPRGAVQGQGRKGARGNCEGATRSGGRSRSGGNRPGTVIGTRPAGGGRRPS